MKKALASFVIISNSIDAGKDSIDAFIPFIIRLFDMKRYPAADVETVCKDFVGEYGIQIPRHPMETMLNRMRPRYIVREQGRVKINLDEIRKSAQSVDLDRETRKHRWLLDDFVAFCAEFPVPVLVTREEADSLFLAFLKDHDIDIICAAYLDEETSILPAGGQAEDSDKKYLVNRYVNALLQKGGEHAEYLIDSAVGHKYASLLLYREFTNMRGQGACQNYYLDTGVLFDLTGINQIFRQRASEDLLALLRAKGSALWVFRHTYEEFQSIVEGCLTWIENNYYDATKASRALQFFKDEGYGVAQVQFFISQIDAVLGRNGISTTNMPDPNMDQYHQIDRVALRNCILEIYNASGHIFDLDDKAHTLERDELSIEGIYKLRRENVPTNLNDATYVLMTTNSGLAYASTRFERETMQRGYFTIPTVITDTFVGTVIWAQERTTLAKDFSRSKLMSYTNAMIQPRASVMSRFAQEVARAKANTVNPISEESAYLLLTSSIPRKLIADRTLGDANRITAGTPYEILREVEKSIAAAERAKTEAAIRKSESSRAGELEAVQNLRAQTATIERLVATIAAVGKWLVIGVLILVAAVVFGIAEFQPTQTLVVKIVTYAFSLLSVVSGLTVFLLGRKVEGWITRRLTEILLASVVKPVG
jgi:hypothetical protein